MQSGDAPGDDEEALSVHELDIETDSPDLVYQFDPLLVSDQGAIPLRPGKPGRFWGADRQQEVWALDYEAYLKSATITRPVP